MMNRETGDAIAVLVTKLRPDWDVRGVMAALSQVKDREPGLVAIAAIRCALVPSNRTPAVIALGGAHWSEKPAGGGALRPYDRHACKSCLFPHDPGDECLRADPEATRRGVAAARAALRGQPTTSTPTTTAGGTA